MFAWEGSHIYAQLFRDLPPHPLDEVRRRRGAWRGLFHTRPADLANEGPGDELYPKRAL